jgi:hypothetical protein
VSVLGADSIPFHEEAAAGGLEPSSFFLLLPSTEYYSIKNRVLFFCGKREREYLQQLVIRTMEGGGSNTPFSATAAPCTAVCLCFFLFIRVSSPITMPSICALLQLFSWNLGLVLFVLSLYKWHSFPSMAQRCCLFHPP